MIKIENWRAQEKFWQLAHWHIGSNYQSGGALGLHAEQRPTVLKVIEMSPRES